MNIDIRKEIINNFKDEDESSIKAAINASIVELKETFMQTIHGQQEKMTEAINNNTLVMQRLVDKLDGEKV